MHKNKSKFPVVMVGGPPNSGKSVLVTAITRRLRQMGKAHYVLRAAPDGEGDWYQEVSPKLGQQLRDKGKFTLDFVSRLEQYLANPVFPLIVDVGGRPTAEQAAIFRHCTHAVLLIGESDANPSLYEQNRQEWVGRMAQQAVPIVADLRSRLTGKGTIHTQEPYLKGTITGLERTRPVEGTVFEALMSTLGSIFFATSEELTHQTLTQAPVELAIDLERLLITLHDADRQNFWQPTDLLPLREYLPAKTSLALYGRAPNWVYATLADLAAPEPLFIFDARLGWVQVPEFQQRPLAELGQMTVQTGWEVQLQETKNEVLVTLQTQSQYLDMRDIDFLPLPRLTADSAHKHLYLSGKLPNWLWMGAVSSYRQRVAAISVFQPQLGNGVAVATQTGSLPIGSLTPLPSFS